MINPLSALSTIQVTLVIAGACFLAGTSGGWIARGYYQDSLELSALKKADQAKENAAEAVSVAASAHQETKSKLNKDKETIYVEVEKIVTRPVYRNVCVDDDGLRELERAIEFGEKGISRSSP